MKALHTWHTPFAQHKIPSAILWLAGKANAMAGCPLLFDTLELGDPNRLYKTPGYRVIEEWGLWREEQDRLEWLKSELQLADEIRAMAEGK